MRRKFVQIAAFFLALCLLPVSYAGAEPETKQIETNVIIINKPLSKVEDSEEDESGSDVPENTVTEEEWTNDSEQGNTESGSEASDSGTDTADDSETTESEQGTAEPDSETIDPEQGTAEPGSETTDPEQGTAEPGSETTEPEQGTTEPGGETTGPEQTVTEPEEPIVPEVIVPVLETEEESGTIVKVGLRYDSGALAGANLLNFVGSGYRFGFEADGVFHKVGYTTQTAISVLKTKNVYYIPKMSDGYSGYSDKTSSNIAVGCVHLQLPGTYATFDETKAAADAVGGFPAWVNGEFRVRVGVYLSADAAREAQTALGLVDAEVVGTSSSGLTVVITGTSTPLFQYDGGTEYPMLVVKPGLDNSEKTQTIFKGNKYYGSFRYERIDGGNLTVVNLVEMEDYIRGILPYEMSGSWPLEALKAQAVSARSYTMTNLNRHSKYHFDTCNTTDCQVYYGTGAASARTEQAVVETSGLYAWYGDEVILAAYHSSDGGATENCENVWNDALPYLRGILDPYEALVAHKIPSYNWTKTYTGAQLQKILNGRGFQCGEIVDVKAKTTDTNNVYSLTFTDVNGKNWTLSKYTMKSLFGFKSMRFSISNGGDGFALTNDQTIGTLYGTWTLDGEGNLVQVSSAPVYALTAEGIVEVPGSELTAGTFVFAGSGSGHNLGMSQWGAYAMANEGYTYDQILKFYFTGIEMHE